MKKSQKSTVAPPAPRPPAPPIRHPQSRPILPIPPPLPQALKDFILNAPSGPGSLPSAFQSAPPTAVPRPPRTSMHHTLQKSQPHSHPPRPVAESHHLHRSQPPPRPQTTPPTSTLSHPPRPFHHLQPPRYLQIPSHPLSASNQPAPPRPMYQYLLTLPSNLNPGEKFVALLGDSKHLFTCPKEKPLTFSVLVHDPPTAGLLLPSPSSTLPEIVGVFRGMWPLLSQQNQLPRVLPSYLPSLPTVSLPPHPKYASLLQTPLLNQFAASQLNPNTQGAVISEEIQQTLELDDFFETTEVHSFQEYSPVYYKDGRPHPDQLVQSASLSGVDPPPITYQLSLPKNV
jgi:hypothetical protein